MDVKTNVYKRMLSLRLPWHLDLFSSQTKTFVSEITGRIRAWKQADSCSEDLPLAVQIGQCLLLVGFNGKFAFFTVGRWTNLGVHVSLFNLLLEDTPKIHDRRKLWDLKTVHLYAVGAHNGCFGPFPFDMPSFTSVPALG